MPTPRPGTVQQDIESLPVGRPKRTFHLLPHLFWAVATIVYSVASSALGRYMLDHYAIWNLPIPQNSHGELIASAIAGCFISPGLELFNFVDKKLVLYRWYPDCSTFWALISVMVVVICIACVAVVVGAVIVQAFDNLSYVTPQIMLAVYAFGSVILLPSVTGAVLLSVVLYAAWGA
ncbi:hypothetical protein DL96DRAFT_1552381 [Flagelloscypha sp. PMI_526]|nr:hypothetical protein DL96DRAFT_1552381 [Flagelloscypha sp. PMI_526]